jgi:hypothetical protein
MDHMTSHRSKHTKIALGIKNTLINDSEGTTTVLQLNHHLKQSHSISILNAQSLSGKYERNNLSTRGLVEIASEQLEAGFKAGLEGLEGLENILLFLEVARPSIK